MDTFKLKQEFKHDKPFLMAVKSFVKRECEKLPITSLKTFTTYDVYVWKHNRAPPACTNLQYFAIVSLKLFGKTIIYLLHVCWPMPICCKAKRKREKTNNKKKTNKKLKKKQKQNIKKPKNKKNSA